MFTSAFHAEDSGNWQKNNGRGFYFMLQVNKSDFVMFVLFLYKDQVTENTGWIDGDLFCSSTSLVCF